MIYNRIAIDVLTQRRSKKVTYVSSPWGIAQVDKIKSFFLEYIYKRRR